MARTSSRASSLNRPAGRWRSWPRPSTRCIASRGAGIYPDLCPLSVRMASSTAVKAQPTRVEQLAPGPVSRHVQVGDQVDATDPNGSAWCHHPGSLIVRAPSAIAHASAVATRHRHHPRWRCPKGKAAAPDGLASDGCSSSPRCPNLDATNDIAATPWPTNPIGRILFITSRLAPELKMVPVSGGSRRRIPGHRSRQSPSCQRQAGRRRERENGAVVLVDQRATLLGPHTENATSAASSDRLYSTPHQDTP